MMKDINEMPEKIRAKIEDFIKEANSDIDYNSALFHMLTSICFEMYKVGFTDSLRIIKKSIEVSEDMIKK